MVDAGARYVLLETGLFVVLGGGLATVGVLTIGATVVGVDIFGVVEASTDTVTVSVTTTGEPLSVEQPATRSKKTELATRTRTSCRAHPSLPYFLIPKANDSCHPSPTEHRRCMTYEGGLACPTDAGPSFQIRRVLRQGSRACVLPSPRREFRQQQIV